MAGARRDRTEVGLGFLPSRWARSWARNPARRSLAAESKETETGSADRSRTASGGPIAKGDTQTPARTVVGDCHCALGEPSIECHELSAGLPLGVGNVVHKEAYGGELVREQGYNLSLVAEPQVPSLPEGEGNSPAR